MNNLKEAGGLQEKIKQFKERFLNKTQKRNIKIISHFDTDGISSAGLIIKTLKKIDKKFTIEIIKNLDEDYISNLPKETPKLFLDLASGSLDKIKKHRLKNVFILDHHEISENSESTLEEENKPENQEKETRIEIINPFIEKENEEQKISASGVTYLFCKEVLDPNTENQGGKQTEEEDLEKLAVLGMIGDRMEKEIDKLNHNILNREEIKKKRGLLIYPSTRPLNRTLEFSSSPFIPNVTGNPEGVRDLLREAGIKPQEENGGKYKSLLELDEKEMSNLITALMLRNPQAKSEEIVGDIYLIKFFNKLEDARELSAIINACSRMDNSEIALKFVLEIHKSKKQAESVYAKYKQHLVSGLNYVSKAEKIQGEDHLIIDAGENIKDTIIGTIASIISYSGVYKEGTTIITLANEEDKNKNRIKISARSAAPSIMDPEGKGSENSGEKTSSRNLKELLERATNELSTKEGIEIGGHEKAAGALIPIEEKENFINSLKKAFEVEKVKV